MKKLKQLQMASRKGYKFIILSCCDCGLTHKVGFDINYHGEVVLTMERHEGFTRKVRKDSDRYPLWDRLKQLEGK